MQKHKQEILKKIEENDNNMYIERNQPCIFDLDEKREGSLYTNYWVGIRSQDNSIEGLIGIQFDMKKYIQLVPRSVLEEPYPLSMISLYDQDHREIWYYGQDDDDPQSHKNAQVRIDEIWEAQGGKYVQWEIPLEINLDLTAEDDSLKEVEESTEELSTEDEEENKEEKVNYMRIQS